MIIFKCDKKNCDMTVTFENAFYKNDAEKGGISISLYPNEVKVLMDALPGNYHVDAKSVILCRFHTMDEDIKKALEEIEGQLYAINARNISLHLIGMKKIPTPAEISQLNALLGFVIQEIRTLKETGKLDIKEVHKRCFPELSED